MRFTILSILHFSCIAFLLLAHAFAHVLVSPAINNLEGVQYVVAGSICNTERKPVILRTSYQELMSGKAAKERVTTAYTRVPSKSKLLANELPNKETTLQIKRHSDDIKTHVFLNSDVRNFTLTQNFL